MSTSITLPAGLDYNCSFIAPNNSRVGSIGLYVVNARTTITFVITRNDTHEIVGKWNNSIEVNYSPVDCPCLSNEGIFLVAGKLYSLTLINAQGTYGGRKDGFAESECVWFSSDHKPEQSSPTNLRLALTILPYNET